MEKIKIILNGEEKETNAGKSIAKLVAELELDVKKIAIEKNYEIIMPEDFERSVLCDKDRIEIVHFIGGG